MGINLRSQGIVFIVSSPSGAGKSSLCGAVINADSRLQLSVSATTRLPRVGERDGHDYHFYSKAVFDEMVVNHEFIEHATIYGNHYGTPKAPVLNALQDNRDVLFDVDTQGMMEIRAANLAQTVSIFILPPSIKELASRLRSRAKDSEEAISRRLGLAEKEMKFASFYDYVVVNDDFYKALEAVQAIITAERYRRHGLDHLGSFIETL